MFTEPRLLVSFRFSDVGTIAGAAREFVNNPRGEISGNLVLEREQLTQPDGSFCGYSDLAIGNILLEKFPHSVFSSGGQLAEVGKMELKGFPLICCFRSLCNKNA